MKFTKSAKIDGHMYYAVASEQRCRICKKQQQRRNEYRPSRPRRLPGCFSVVQYSCSRPYAKFGFSSFFLHIFKCVLRGPHKKDNEKWVVRVVTECARAEWE